MFLDNKQLTEEIKREIKTLLETNDHKNMTTQNLRDAAKGVPREIYSNKVLLQETRKTLNRQPSFTPRTTGKRTAKTPQISRQKS